MSPSDRGPVWDWPVRVIHWYFPLAIAFMWWSGEEGEMVWHSWCGYSLLIAALTRIAWGFVGSYHARFSNFMRSPGTVWAYLKGRPYSEAGHNPIGGWSTLILLLLVVLQASSGLFSNDDIAFEGPLSYWAGDLSSTITELHELNWTVLSALIVLHVGAILFYRVIKKQDLIKAMINGGRDHITREVAPPSAVWALVIAAFLGLLLYSIIVIAPETPSYY